MILYLCSLASLGTMPSGAYTLDVILMYDPKPSADVYNPAHYLAIRLSFVSWRLMQSSWRSYLEMTVRSNEPFSCETCKISLSENDMVQHSDIDHAPGLNQLPGYFQVVLTWSRIPAGMVVHEDYRGR